MKTMKKLALVGGALLTAALAAVSVGAQAEKPGTIFDLTAEQFNARFLSGMQAAQLPVPNKDADFQVRDQYSTMYQWKMDNYAELNGMAAGGDDGKMGMAQLYTFGDGTQKSAELALARASTFFTAARGPSFSMEEKRASAKIVLDLVEKLHARGNSTKEPSVVKGPIRYSANQQEGVGTWFTVEAEDDN